MVGVVGKVARGVSKFKLGDRVWTSEFTLQINRNLTFTSKSSGHKHILPRLSRRVLPRSRRFSSTYRASHQHFFRIGSLLKRRWPNFRHVLSSVGFRSH